MYTRFPEGDFQTWPELRSALPVGEVTRVGELRSSARSLTTLCSSWRLTNERFFAHGTLGPGQHSGGASFGEKPGQQRYDNQQADFPAHFFLP
jgi:hypothetical protein